MIWSLRSAVAAVFLEFRLRAVGFRSARAERALVHLAAHAEGACLRELRCAERARVKAVAAADAKILVVQDHAVVGVIDAIHRAYGNAGCVRTMHASDRNRALAGHAVVDRDDTAAV